MSLLAVYRSTVWLLGNAAVFDDVRSLVKLVLSLILAKSYLSTTSIWVAQVLWNCACTVLCAKLWKDWATRKLWANMISWGLSLDWVSAGYPVLQKASWMLTCWAGLQGCGYGTWPHCSSWDTPPHRPSAWIPGSVGTTPASSAAPESPEISVEKMARVSFWNIQWIIVFSHHNSVVYQHHCSTTVIELL